MATKKVSTTKKTPPSHPAYKDMIKDAILQLKERNGSSRHQLKKFIQSNYKITAPNFESLFNAALRKGVTTGDFVQPKGPSGTVKLKKKEAGEKKPAKKPVKKVEAAKKPAVKKEVKKPAVKKEAAKKAPAKKAVVKKAEESKVTKKPAAKAAPAKKAAAKPRAKKAATKAEN